VKARHLVFFKKKIVACSTFGIFMSYEADLLKFFVDEDVICCNVSHRSCSLQKPSWEKTATIMRER
jgi:hypothetical protein